MTADDQVRAARKVADDAAAAALDGVLRRRIEALAEEWERTAAECARLAEVRSDLSDAGSLRTAALVNGRRANDLRAALTPPP